MKFGVVVFPGSNCDDDMVYVLKEILKQDVVKLWHKEHTLQNCDFIVLPGGFSYGDYLRSGAIARFSPIMQEVIEFANKGGFVFGVCNGFQILCESHLLPGALLRNTDGKFSCKNVFVRAETDETILTSSLRIGKALKIPIAHGEGRFYADEKTMLNLRQNNQVIFRYCNSEGHIVDDANPNGSLENVAGICNEKRNVFGMMPHPERACDANLGNTDGLGVMKSILNYVEA
ncbi:MAG: phosphoribosylformylglycinamidine synthase subunit PurQ [Bacteroidetes bacterium]|nr:phosphoribosylformylglycinamidine synthase subunit PurQ [Bacteroidota bacterium]HNR19161.1 phosphoribosylformylglycinamidine synthase subunit PurQ [Bacteroidia bacterium]HNU32589.1 phosphoribosylformylglycinamidine synthase subunit PurQ [Bacteroidia bacterium]